MRYSAAFLDFIFLFSSLAALFILIVRRKKYLQFDIRLILSVLIVSHIIYSLCLLIEWTGITDFLDPYEDFIGATIPMMWAFFIYAILQNIAKLELKKSEDRYRRLFEQSNDLIIISKRGLITDVNQKACDVLGYSRDKLLMMKVPDLHPEEFEKDTVERINRIKIHGAHMFEAVMVKANGELIDVEISASLIDPEKDIIQGMIRDITERKTSEKLLKESEEKYRILAEYANDVIFTLDLDLNYTYVSPSYERLRGYRPDEVKGINILTMLTPESRIAARKLFEGSLSEMRKQFNGNPDFRRSEMEIFRKDGSTVWCEVVLSFIYDSELKPVKILGVSRDISDRKKAEKEKKSLEEQLRQTQKMEAIGTLAGGIAHDFNNILSIIFGFTDLAMMDIHSPEKISEDLRELSKASFRAKDLINQILTISRQTKQEKMPLRISLGIKEALKLLKSTIPSSIEITQDIRSQGTVMADATQIHQIIMNLCTNAYHAIGDKGGKLCISVGDIIISKEDCLEGYDMTPGKYIKLEVSDTGHGMDTQTIERIFEPYFTTKKTGEGTGLGLAVVHSIVESYGGIIKVFSEPGEGTTFNIYLPAYEGKTATEKSPDHVQEIKGGNERIIYVDDEEIIINIAESVLGKYGYKPFTFKSSIEALEEYRKDPSQYDMVITDMTMPRMNGIELLEKVRELRPDIPAILCSGYNRLIDLNRLEGMNIEYLGKPVIVSDLLIRIRQIFDKRIHGK